MFNGFKLQLNSLFPLHGSVQTMFELISGYGVWHRRYFVLEGCSMYYWNHPNDKETKVWIDQQTDLHTKSLTYF